MPAWMLLARGGLVLPLFLTFGVTVDSERLPDRYRPLPAHADMDARLTRYVPVHQATLAALGDRGSTEAALGAAELWDSGLRRGALLPAMPARYGDGSNEGPKSELVGGALALSSALVAMGRERLRAGDREGGRRCLLASLAPVRAVRLFDLGTVLATGKSFRTAALSLHRAGFAREAAATEREARPSAAEMRTLLTHLAKLRAEFRAQYGACLDEGVLVNADLLSERALAGGLRLTSRTRR